MDITYLLIICATVSVLVLAALDAVKARRDSSPIQPQVGSARRALSK